MNVLFLFLATISFCTLVAGLIQPSFVKIKSRRIAASAFGGATIVFMILLVATTPQQQTNSAATNIQLAAKAPSATSTPNNDQTAPLADNMKATQILSSSTNYYTQLFAAGKAALGTTQYADAFAGLEAFNDPDSAASKFGAFRTDTCLKNDIGANATKAYQNASNLYPDSGTLGFLDDWYYDINFVESDICIWAGDAVGWQIKTITTAQLNADGQKVSTDLANARVDIGKIK